jgi:dienelactone hydrolase
VSVLLSNGSSLSLSTRNSRGDEFIVPPEASEEWVEALRRAGKTFEYKTYAGEPHGFLKHENRLDVYRRIERFFDWYLWPFPSSE